MMIPAPSGPFPTKGGSRSSGGSLTARLGGGELLSRSSVQVESRWPSAAVEVALDSLLS